MYVPASHRRRREPECRAAPDFTGAWASGPWRRRRPIRSRFRDTPKMDWVMQWAMQSGATICATDPGLCFGPQRARPLATWFGAPESPVPQTDYIFCIVGSCVAWGAGDPAYSSDYAALWAKLTVASWRTPMTTTTRDSLKDWTPVSDSDRRRFRRAAHLATRDLCAAPHTSSVGATGSASQALVLWEAVAVSAASETRQSHQKRDPGRPRCPAELRMLERDASRPHTDPTDRHDLRRRARAMRWRWKPDLATWELRASWGVRHPLPFAPAPALLPVTHPGGSLIPAATAS